MSNSRKDKSFDKFKVFMVFAFALIIVSSCLLNTRRVFAETELTFRTSQQVYVPGETLEVSGTAEPSDILVFRLYDPAGLAIRIENVEVHKDGIFKGPIFVWPEPSRYFVFGTYTIEVLSNTAGVAPARAEVAFAGGFDQGIDPTKGHQLEVKLDAPSQVKVNEPFRIFVQITFDGALVESADEKAVADMLGTSHIHSGNSTVILSDKFRQLHPGIYYADAELAGEDTYIIHAVAYYRGFLAHDTRLVAASTSSIGTLQDSVDRLNAGLESTNRDLDVLRSGLDETQSALNDTKATIAKSVNDAQNSINNQIGEAQQASSQINSFILPVLALISVIVALQISLFARIRASYR